MQSQLVEAYPAAETNTPGLRGKAPEVHVSFVFKTQLSPWLLKTPAAPGQGLLQDFPAAERVGGVEKGCAEVGSS